MVQNVANECIMKDIQKTKRHLSIIKREEKDSEQEKKWLTELNDKIVEEWKAKCEKLEEQIEKMYSNKETA